MKKERKTSRTPSNWGIQPLNCDDGVSPVIGVMLMLVVTIIIAAVVSGFAGGLVGDGNQNPPTLTMDVDIINSGAARSSEFSAMVLGVSEPIPTKDLKILTSWETTVKTNTFTKEGWISDSPETTEPGRGCVLGLPIGTPYHGGAEILPGGTNSWTGKTGRSVAPYGFGPGVGNLSESDMGGYMYNGPIVSSNNWHFFAVTHFGNFSLEQGTVMMAAPAGKCVYYANLGGDPDMDCTGLGGYAPRLVEVPETGQKRAYDPYRYGSGSVYSVYTGDKTTPMDIIADGGQVDGMQAVLGCGWENLRAGDVVNVKIIHTPSGKTIFNKDVMVKDS